MLANLSVFRKGIVLVSLPLLAQLAFLLVLLRARSERLEAERWALHTKDVIATGAAVLHLATETHSALRGLIITGNPTFTTEYERLTGEQLRASFATLRALVTDNRRQAAALDRVEADLARLTAWQRDLRHMVADGRAEEALAVVKSLEGQRRLEALRASLDAFIGEEERLGAEQREQLRSDDQRETQMLAGGAIASLGGTLLLLVMFSRGIAARVASVVENARSLAEGKDLAPALPGTDEFARLDRVVHETADALAEKDRDNEMFVYSVSHDLRSPLVNLQGFSQELAAVNAELRALFQERGVPEDVRRRGLGLVDRDGAEAIAFIQTAVARLASIIDALLRLSRAGRVEYAWQPVDVKAAATRVTDALAQTLAERGADVELGELPPCWGDPTAVEQVFANLIGNAASYLAPERPGRIRVGSVDDGTMRRYFVADNGRGIAPAHLPKLFVAFQRLHPEAAAGEGIGLALVRRVVERHGGRVWAESSPGEGSVFWVTLPAEPDRARMTRAPRVSERPISGASGERADHTT